MDLDESFANNFTSIVGVSFVTIIACFTAIKKLRKRWPITVNCWFCNNDTKIHWEQKDWWLCRSCEQYNGFAKDGNYNYDIPEQFKEPEDNFIRYTQPWSTKQLKTKNGLCSKCNRNEEIKVSKLADFEPSSYSKYDSELEAFKESLEQKYKLCTKCTKSVQGILSEQASWLLQYKMAFFKNKPIQEIIKNSDKWERIFRICLTIINSIILYDATAWPLPIAGLSLQLAAGLASPVEGRGLDMLAAFFWIFVIILMPFDELKLIKLHLKNKWFIIDFVTQYHVIIGLTTIIGLMNLRCGIFKAKRKPIVSFKKLDSPTAKKIQPIAPMPTPMRTSLFEEHNSRSENCDMKPCRSPVNITNLLMTPISVETPMPIKPTMFEENSRIFRTNPVRNTTVQENVCKSEHYSSFDEYRSSPGLYEEKAALDESMSTLSSLSLSDGFPRHISRTPKIFQTKVYAGPGSDLFSKSTKSTRKFVLSPPKLKSVTQASWVAGGYWQAGISAPTLSRSSSQSSGFGSIGSNFIPSREPSVYNDCDRYSVVSDATQYCHMSRQNSVNSLASCCQPSPTFSFQRPDSPVYNHCQKRMPYSTPTQIDRNSVQNSPINHQLQNQTILANDSGFTREVPVQTIHTTVLTSPVWLPILLCGSLVFNMIVLCTTLLR